MNASRLTFGLYDEENNGVADVVYMDGNTGKKSSLALSATFSSRATPSLSEVFMNLLRISLLTAAFALVSLTALAADWPQWRGPNRDGKSADTGLLKAWPKDGPKLLWTFDKAGVGYSGPAVVGDKLYILGADDPEKGDNEFAICVSVKDGKADLAAKA